MLRLRYAGEVGLENPVNKKWETAKKMKILYVMLLFPLIQLFIFHYIPIYGILIAFKDYRVSDGIIGSPWNNFEHFRLFFNSFMFKRVFFNTLIISLLKLLVNFPAPIIFALLLNEVTNTKFKKTVQTISYLPHFLSWVVVSGIILEVLSPERGAINYIITLLGGEPVYFMISKLWFRPILVLSDVWKGVGWGAIIYLATLSSIDPGLYDSADIDGANRFQKAWNISLPSLVPVIIILLLLNLGHILNAGFDQVFNMYNPLVYEVGDIIDTYVYRVGLQEGRYGFSTAVGLFKNVIGVILIVGSNMVVKRYSEYGIW